MPGAKVWAYIITVATVAVWGGLQLIDRSLPAWALVLAGLVVIGLFTAHYTGEYTA